MPTRRRFLQDGVTAAVAFVAIGCSPRRKSSPASTTTYPRSDRFGDRIDVGPVDDLVASIAKAHAPRYVPEARSYVSPFPKDVDASALAVYPDELAPVLAAGLVVLYQKCPHLGCRVPFCESSQWFECPCHGAAFDQVGESRAGPSPRGMDFMTASIERGRLVIDTGAQITPGVPKGTTTTDERPAGPLCVGSYEPN